MQDKNIIHFACSFGWYTFALLVQLKLKDFAQGHNHGSVAGFKLMTF